VIAGGGNVQKRLLDAIRNGDLQACVEAIDAGADVNACQGSWSTPLQLAVTQNRVGIARMLMERGADPHVRYYGNERSLLHVACCAPKGELGLVETLIALEVALDARDNDGCTALHDAAMVGRSDIVRALLEAGACVDAITEGGATVLHKAIEASDLDSCRLLVRGGLLPSFCYDREVLDGDPRRTPRRVGPPRDYLSPVQYAMLLDRDDIFRYFIEECDEPTEQVTLDGRSSRDLVRSAPRIAGYLRAVTTQAAVTGAIEGVAGACQPRSGMAPL
jgi:ankyrin repeat protein